MRASWGKKERESISDKQLNLLKLASDSASLYLFTWFGGGCVCVLLFAAAFLSCFVLTVGKPWQSSVSCTRLARRNMPVL